MLIHHAGIPMGPKFEYFCTGKWESPAKHLPFWGKWQIWAEPAGTCIVWIPLQCEIPVAKRANSYSAAMVMTCKTGERPSNSAPPKADTHFRTRLNLRTTVPFVTAHLEIIHCTHHPVIPKSDLYYTFCSALNALSKRTSK